MKYLRAMTRSSMRPHHVPTPYRDEYHGNHPAQSAANHLRLTCPEFVSQQWPDLAADQPPYRSADDPTDQPKYWSAEQQGRVSGDNCRRNPDRKQTANGSYYRPSQCAHVCLANRRSFHRCSIGTNGRGSGPIYSAVGRISRLLPRCSIIWADHPDVRAITKSGVNIGVGTPQKW